MPFLHRHRRSTAAAVLRQYAPSGVEPPPEVSFFLLPDGRRVPSRLMVNGTVLHVPKRIRLLHFLLANATKQCYANSSYITHDVLRLHILICASLDLRQWSDHVGGLGPGRGPLESSVEASSKCRIRLSSLHHIGFRCNLRRQPSLPAGHGHSASKESKVKVC
jgi:hypothetical protein